MLRKLFIDSNNEAAFHRDGYIVLDLLTEEDVTKLKTAFGIVEKQHSFDIAASVVLPDLEMRRFVHQSITPIFEQRVRPLLNKYKIILGSFVAKCGGSEQSKFPLHQDPTFVEEEHHVGLSIWCPLIDVDMSNGCLGLLPGSHRLNNLYRSPCMLPYTEIEGILESEYMKYIPMKKGEVLLMNTRTIHGSPPNLSSTIRPVAAGVAIPEHLPVLCCYSSMDENAKETTVYQVPDDFYLRHTMTTFPQEGRLYKTVSNHIESLSIEKIETQFSI